LQEKVKSRTGLACRPVFGHHRPMPHLADTPICRRCGTCCRLGGPALHRSDLPLVTGGLLPLAALRTLRRGEYVTDNVAGGIGPAPAELVTIAPGPDGRTCRFFTPPGTCAIHTDRPLECRLLFCDAPQALAAAYDRDRLSRADILGPAHPLAALCADHEVVVDLPRLASLCRAALAGDTTARDEAMGLIRYDAAYRELLPAKAGVPPAAIPFYLGRPPREALPATRALLARCGLYKAGPSA